MVIISHELKRTKIKIKIQVTKAKEEKKKKKSSPLLSLHKYSLPLYLLLFLLSHFFTSSSFLPLFFLTHFYLFTFSPSQDSQYQQPIQASFIPQPTQTLFSSFSKEKLRSLGMVLTRSLSTNHLLWLPMRFVHVDR